jgi:hypothetical protein
VVYLKLVPSHRTRVEVGAGDRSSSVTMRTDCKTTVIEWKTDMVSLSIRHLARMHITWW